MLAAPENTWVNFRVKKDLDKNLYARSESSKAFDDSDDQARTDH